MKKLLPVFLIVCLLLSGCGKAKTISYAGVTKITVASFEHESFPLQKTVDKTKDIETIINYINNIETDKCSKKKVDRWFMSLLITGVNDPVTIDISEEYIVIDGKWYEIGSTALSELQNIYYNLEYYEVDYVKPEEEK